MNLFLFEYCLLFGFYFFVFFPSTLKVPVQYKVD